MLYNKRPVTLWTQNLPLHGEFPALKFVEVRHFSSLHVYVGLVSWSYKSFSAPRNISDQSGPLDLGNVEMELWHGLRGIG